MNPVHRIEPRLLSVPQFYGSPGEPLLGQMPSPVMPPFSRLQAPQAQGPGMTPLLGLLAAGLFSQGAQAPNMGLLAMPEKPNDEPLDIMPDDLPFKKAFAQARKMGLVEFTWRGKPYTTQLKE
jgi:hypothetical protein